MLLLYVADNKDLLRSIWKATDQDKNTPHHIAAKARNLDLLKVSISLRIITSSTPFTCLYTRPLCGTILRALKKETERDLLLFILQSVKENFRKSYTAIVSQLCHRNRLPVG